MTEHVQSAVTELLEANHIDYDVITIPLSDDNKPIRNLEALLKEQNRDPHSVVRSLLFKTGEGDFVLLAVAGGGRADWGKLRQHLEVRKLKMADLGDVEPATGYRVGAVPPVALPETVTVLADSSLDDYDDIIIGSGVLGYALALKQSDLKKLMTGVPTDSFTKD